MKDSGTAMLGVGCATGRNRAEEAALSATAAPLIQTTIKSATGNEARTHIHTHRRTSNVTTIHTRTGESACE